MHAALAIGALQMLEFVVYAAITTGALQVSAFSDTFMFICMLLLPSGLYRSLNLLFTPLLPSELCKGL